MHVILLKHSTPDYFFRPLSVAASTARYHPAPEPPSQTPPTVHISDLGYLSVPGTLQRSIIVLSHRPSIPRSRTCGKQIAPRAQTGYHDRRIQTALEAASSYTHRTRWCNSTLRRVCCNRPCRARHLGMYHRQFGNAQERTVGPVFRRCNSGRRRGLGLRQQRDEYPGSWRPGLGDTERQAYGRGDRRRCRFGGKVGLARKEGKEHTRQPACGRIRQVAR